MSSFRPVGPLRLGLAYAALYLGTGITSPYIPLWLRSAGLSGGEIGVVLAAPLLARIVTGPLIAFWADRFRFRRTAVIILTLICALTTALLLSPLNFAGIFVLWFIAATTLGACSPLLDVIVLRRAMQEHFAYATPRGIGSAAYVLGNIAFGFLLVPFGVEIVVIGSAAAALLSALAIRLLVPRDAVHDGAVDMDHRPVAALAALVRDRNFRLLIVAAGLIQAANAFYYGFSALVWRSQGIDPGAIGLLWGMGVTCEVAFLWFLEPWRRRLGPEWLLIVAAVASIVRWTALAFSPPLWALWVLQALHALTLSAPFIAALQLVDRLAPKRSASAAQQVSAALAAGVFMGLATLAGGPIYDRIGALGYLLMTAMAFIGLLFAIRLRASLSARA